MELGLQNKFHLYDFLSLLSKNISLLSKYDKMLLIFSFGVGAQMFGMAF